MKQQTGVGYARPPRDHQFKPGVSGNPKGRPKGSRNFLTDLREELATLVPAQDGMQQITKQRAIVNRLVANAIAGDARATGIIVSRFMKDQETGAEFETVQEREILNQFRKKPRKDDDHE